ncbi:MAG: hypothetical protein NVS3B18_01660 [Candidatus Dormibacteria bacterium]
MPNLSQDPQNDPEPRPFRTEWDVTALTIDGVRVAAVLPVVPEDASAEVKEAVARRRIVMLKGSCPCGAIRRLPNRAARRAAQHGRTPLRLKATIVHEADCIASDEHLRALGWHGFGE